MSLLRNRLEENQREEGKKLIAGLAVDLFLYAKNSGLIVVKDKLWQEREVTRLEIKAQNFYKKF